MKFKRVAATASLALLLAAPAFAAEPKITRNVTYTRRGSARQRLDVYAPTVAPKGAGRPAVLVIHGGGFVGGVREQMAALGRELAARGLVAFNIDYRLGPRSTFPAGIEDVRCALRFIGAHAREYGADPTRIGVTGESAGGYLSAMAAYPAPGDFPDPTCATPGPVPPVRAAALYYGVYDLERSYYLPFPAIHQMYWMALWTAPTKDPARYAQFAVEPVVERQVRSGATLPPTLLLAGDVDPLYPETLLLYQKLRLLGQDAELQVYPGAAHGFVLYPKKYPAPVSRIRAAEWLAQRLGKSEE